MKRYSMKNELLHLVSEYAKSIHMCAADDLAGLEVQKINSSLYLHHPGHVS